MDDEELPPEREISGEQLELLLGRPPAGPRCVNCNRAPCTPKDCEAATEFRRYARSTFGRVPWE